MRISAQAHMVDLNAPSITFLPTRDARDPQTLSWTDLDTAARSLGARLRQRGARSGPVVVACPPGLEHAIAFYACMYAGCSAGWLDIAGA